MAHCRLITLLLLFGSLMLAGCSQKPLSRMDSYLGGAGQGKGSAAPVQSQSVTGTFDVGLLLINDTSAKGSAPALSDHGKDFLTDQVRRRVEPATPIRVVKVLTVADPSQHQDRQALARLAQKQGLAYLMVALFSSEESVVPAYMSILGDPEQGGGRGNVLGIETVNYALAELALIDASSAQVIARSEGRAWSRLNELNVPIKSNAYPVIHRSLRNPPIFPPEDQAKDVLRGIAGDEALEQAVAKLGQAWSKS
jgi:hypothetical protein